MGELISFNPEPHVKPTPGTNNILVLGGGITGLVTSWVLLDPGYNVTIMSKQWVSYTKGQRITSQIVGALWEFPPAVCGQHLDPISLHHSERWCMVAYKIWDTIAADSKLSQASGVRMKNQPFSSQREWKMTKSSTGRCWRSSPPKSADFNTPAA